MSSPVQNSKATASVQAEGLTVLLAPLAGELVSLDRVPDPVFSQRMVGDGVAIDPLDHILRAPCDGEILQLHPARHAVTVRMADGVEVLMHVGLDTVNLKGEGFSARVKQGDIVSVGTPLIEFDLDFVATHAKSVLTVIVVTTSERISGMEPASGMVVAGRDPILSFRPTQAETSAPISAGRRIVSEPILIQNATGLHARPAAVLAHAARAFRSDLRLQFGNKHANAKSVTSIMMLEAGQGANVVVIGQGTDAAEAVAMLTGVLVRGLRDDAIESTPAALILALPEQTAAGRSSQPRDPELLTGASASPGLAVGTVFQVRHKEIAVTESAEDPEHERKQLHSALDQAKGQLTALQAQLRDSNDSVKAAIFAAHSEFLEDPDLLGIATSGVAKGKSAAFAWQSAFRTHADRLAALQNELLAQRANDLHDVGHRVLELLTGTEPTLPEYPPDAVLIAEDLTPSDTAALNPGRVVGFCTIRGGATSHVAILARSLGIPALAGVEPRALDIPNGTPAILDADLGVLRLNPSSAAMADIRTRQRTAATKRDDDLAHAGEPAVTVDGHRMEVVANIGGLPEAQQINGLGAEGVGLLRSEFLFMERSSAPTEDEQFETYRAIAQAVGSEKPLIIRTLDVGGDKPLAYLPIPAETNPFLGERGIRVALARPDILRTQLRAILRASPFGKIRVMFPMIGTMAELREAKAILREEAASLGVPPVAAGIMVEVPAAAVMAAHFAKEADFLSVGTNDLTQYTLAMDRGHPRLAAQVDGLNPAVLRLIAQSVTGAHSQGKWIGVCGGIAADAHAVPILVGMGVDELSVNLPAIPAVKAQIRSLRLSTCRELAEQALECDTPGDVRALVARLSRQVTPEPAIDS